MNRIDAIETVATDNLQMAVRGQSWAWLSAIARELAIDVEIVNEFGSVCSHFAPESSDSTIRRLAQQPAFESLVLDALQSVGGARTSIEENDLTAFRLDLGSAISGVLILRGARSGGTGSHQSGVPADLDTLGPWLTRAVEAQLSQGLREDPDGFDRISSLHALLHDVVDRGVEQDVVTTFAEALVAWDGVEVSGYVQDVQGQLCLAVAAPGAERGSAIVPQVSGAMRPPSTLTRLSADDLKRFGFRPDRNLLAMEILSASPDPWLLVFAQGFGSLDRSRLTTYIDLLRQALSRASLIAETRTAWAIMHPLLSVTDDPGRAVLAALAGLKSLVSGITATFTVTSTTGADVLGVSDGPAPSSAEAATGRLISTTTVMDSYTAVLTVHRSTGENFTRREQRLVERTSAILAGWLPGTLGVLGRTTDRRSEHREFEEVLDRAAAQTTRDGIDVSMLVISAPDAGSYPGVLQRLVAEIRGQLRGSDLAGALSEREIGVLLSGTSAEQVPVVCQRIRQQPTLARNKGPASTIGAATRAAGQMGASSLVSAARRALGHAEMNGSES